MVSMKSECGTCGHEAKWCCGYISLKDSGPHSPSTTTNMSDPDSSDSPDRMPHPDRQDFVPGHAPLSDGSSSPVPPKPVQSVEAKPHETPDKLVEYGSKISEDAKEEAVLKAPMGFRCIITLADHFIGTLQMAHVLRRAIPQSTVRRHHICFIYRLN